MFIEDSLHTSTMLGTLVSLLSRQNIQFSIQTIMLLTVKGALLKILQDNRCKPALPQQGQDLGPICLCHILCFINNSQHAYKNISIYSFNVLFPYYISRVRIFLTIRTVVPGIYKYLWIEERSKRLDKEQISDENIARMHTLIAAL
jgi:hypothetical protein